METSKRNLQKKTSEIKLPKEGKESGASASAVLDDSKIVLLLPFVTWDFGATNRRRTECFSPSEHVFLDPVLSASPCVTRSGDMQVSKKTVETPSARKDP